MDGYEQQFHSPSGNILIVDDDHQTCDLLSMLFRRAGYRTTVAYDGRHALQQVETTQPDLVVLDVMMPVMDGWETFRRLRDVASMPVIFLSALSSGESAAMALQMGADDYMRKPFSTRELLCRVEMLFTRSRAVSDLVNDGSRGAALEIRSENAQPSSPGIDGLQSAELKETEEFLASIILPAYNEAAAIHMVLDDLYEVLDGNHEIIVVDDGSTDQTAEIAARYPCRVIQHKQNQGKGMAVRTGIHRARGAYIVIMDADGSYPAEALPELISMLAKYDMVRGIRQPGKGSMPAINQVGNKLFDIILARFGIDCDDHLSGLYGLHRDQLLDMDLDSDGFDLEAEISIKARSRRLNITNIPVEYKPRLGEKKLRPWRDGWRILSRILVSILIFNPVLTFIYPGLAMMFLSGLGAFILKESTLITPYFGLSVHSFILAAVGILAGFQIVIFGMAASLYSVETGVKPAAWLIHLSSRPLRLGVAAGGLFLAIIGLLQNLALFLDWVSGGAADFFATRQLVLNSTVFVWGLQLLSATLFLSIFADRLQKMARQDEPVETSARLDAALIR